MRMLQATTKYAAVRSDELSLDLYTNLLGKKLLLSFVPLELVKKQRRQRWPANTASVFNKIHSMHVLKMQ